MSGKLYRHTFNLMTQQFYNGKTITTKDLEAFYNISNSNTINRSIDAPKQLLLIFRNCEQLFESI